MTLMKQARAFGVGVVLSTQNPVDVDYKALSNAGTWFIGKLGTDQDKQRLSMRVSARANEAPAPRCIVNIAPEILTARSLSRMPSAVPISTWSRGSNS